MIKLLLTFLLFTDIAFAQDNRPKKIIPAAERMDVYLPFLKNKSVAVFANASSEVGKLHLIDTLLKRGIRIKKIFAPEHGFRNECK